MNTNIQGDFQICLTVPLSPNACFLRPFFKNLHVIKSACFLFRESKWAIQFIQMYTILISLSLALKELFIWLINQFVPLHLRVLNGPHHIRHRPRHKGDVTCLENLC